MEMNQVDETQNHSRGGGNWSDSIATEFVDQNWYNPNFRKQQTNIIQESVTPMLIPQKQNHIPHQQVMNSLKGPNSLEQQNKILHHLNSNPQMMSSFKTQQRQQSSMNGAGDPMGSNKMQHQPRLQHMQPQNQVHHYQQQCQQQFTANHRVQQQQFQGHSEMVAGAQNPQQYGVAGGPVGPIGVDDSSMEHNRAYEQLIDSLKRATTIAQQKKILQTLRSNPSLMAVYLQRNKEGNEFHEGRIEPMSHSHQHGQQAGVRSMVHQQQSSMRPMISPQQSSIRSMIPSQQSTMLPMLSPQQSSMRPLLSPQQSSIRPMFSQQQQQQPSPMSQQYQQHQFQSGMEINGRIPQAGLVCKENISTVSDEAYQQLQHTSKSPKISNQNQQVNHNLKSSPAVVAALLKHRKKPTGQNSGGAGSSVSRETEKQDSSVQNMRSQQQMQQEPYLTQVHQQQQMQQTLHQSQINQESVVKTEPVNQIESDLEQNRAYQQLKGILKSPNTPERQNQILRLVKSNPSLMVIFAKKRQQLDQKDGAVGFLLQSLQSTQVPCVEQQQIPVYPQQQRPPQQQQEDNRQQQHQQNKQQEYQQQQRQYQHQQQLPGIGDTPSMQNQASQNLKTVLYCTSSPGKINQITHSQQKLLGKRDATSMQNRASHHLMTALTCSNSPEKIDQITYQQQQQRLGIGDTSSMQNKAPHQPLITSSPEKINQTTNALQNKPKETADFGEELLKLEEIEREAYISSPIDQQLLDMQQMLIEQHQKQEEQHQQKIQKKLQQQQQKHEKQKQERERKKKIRKNMEIYSLRLSSQADQDETFSDSLSPFYDTQSLLDYGCYTEDCSLAKWKPPSPMQHLMQLVEAPSPIFSPESNVSPESPRNHSVFSPGGGLILSPYQHAYRPSRGNQKPSLDHELHVPSEMMPVAIPVTNEDVSEMSEMSTQELLQNFVNSL